MSTPPAPAPSSPLLRCGVVLRVREEACEVLTGGGALTVPYAAPFPSPRRERVSPGNLVALGAGPDDVETVVWRWYDAVVLEAGTDRVRLWEPAHGEVVARPRDPRAVYRPGTRAYLSAGLPGADWWVAGPAVAVAEDAEVELDVVADFCREHGLPGAGPVG